MKKSELIEEKSRSEWEQLINEWIFNKQDREILKLRLLDGEQLKIIADKVNLTLDSLKYRLYKAEEKLFKHIDK